MTSSKMSKKVYQEECIDRTISFAKWQIANTIFPSYDPVYAEERKTKGIILIIILVLFISFIINIIYILCIFLFILVLFIEYLYYKGVISVATHYIDYCCKI